MGMINLGKVFGGVVKALKPIATAALQAASGPAVNLLKNVVGSGFDGIKGAATQLAGRLPFVGGLASKLLGQGIDKLKGLAQDGIEKFVKGLVDKIAPRELPGAAPGTTVTTPPLADRAANIGREVGAITNAATGIVNGTGATGSASASGGSVIDQASSTFKGNLGEFSSVEKDMLAQAKANGASDGQIKMMELQFKMQHLQEIMSAISNVMKKQNEIAMAVIGNLR